MGGLPPDHTADRVWAMITPTRNRCSGHWSIVHNGRLRALRIYRQYATGCSGLQPGITTNTAIAASALWHRFNVTEAKIRRYWRTERPFTKKPGKGTHCGGLVGWETGSTSRKYPWTPASLRVQKRRQLKIWENGDNYLEKHRRGLACKSHYCAISVIVISPWIADETTLALNASEWLRRGLLIISRFIYGTYDAEKRSVYPLIALLKIQGLVLSNWHTRIAAFRFQ
jgi:hypothetical protein